MIKILFQVYATGLMLHQVLCDECDTFPELKSGQDVTCCEFPIFVNDSWIDQCSDLDTLVLANKSAPKYLERESKLYECLFKKSGGVVDGKPSAAEIKRQMKIILDQNPGWENIFNAAVDKCVPEAIAQEGETRKRTSEPPYNFDKNVNTMYGHLVFCIAAHLFLECPVPIAVKNPNCVTLKNYIRKCVNEYPPRFMKPQANNQLPRIR